ncbi:MAG: ATP-binding cassette domain-containing protein [Methyloligellaceae bacterium]
MLDAVSTYSSTADNRRTKPGLLEVRGVTFEAGGRTLIDHIDLVLRRGTLTVILGPNGAGKSLLLRLMHGLLTPASGEILMRGEASTRQTRRGQAMVFQDPVLLRRSAKANIAHALKLHGAGSTERRTRAATALEEAGLAHLANSPARRLSGGEQQRLALARALALEPEIIFLDEPTASLDPASVKAIEGVIASTHARGVKVVLVTHDVGQARRLAGEVVFLNRGKITEAGPATAFFNTPKSAPARQFLAGEIVE